MRFPRFFLLVCAGFCAGGALAVWQHDWAAGAWWAFTLLVLIGIVDAVMEEP